MVFTEQIQGYIYIKFWFLLDCNYNLFLLKVCTFTQREIADLTIEALVWASITKCFL